MTLNHFILLSVMVVIAASQRPPYAGRRPIGYPIIEALAPAVDPLANKFGENQNSTSNSTTTTTTTTTQRLPIEALGDRDLVNRLGQLPQDKQPFWFLNWQALEEHRKQPVSYPQRPSVFAENAISFPQDSAQGQNIQNPQNVQSNQTVRNV